MPKAFLCVMIAVLLVGCPREELDLINPKLHASPAPAKDYFPFVKGATWTYVFNVQGDNVGGSTISVKMMDVVASGDQEIARVEKSYWARFGDPNVANYSYVKDPAGITSTSASGVIDRIVAFPLVVGTRNLGLATTSVLTDNVGEWRSVFSDVNQTINVTSTNWSADCISSTRAYNWSMFSPIGTWSWNISSTTMFAPNIGPVRWTSSTEGDQTQIQELATYTIHIH